MKINNWKLKIADFPETECNSPCSVYSVLLENGLIDDPFYRSNEKKYTKLSEYDCKFKSEFNADNKILKKEYVYLKLNGIDTISSVFINNIAVGTTNNMHRTYWFDIKPYIISGDNTIRISIKSPLKKMKQLEELHHVYTNKDTVQGASQIRKALYMSGWDWGPTLPDMGIFREVEIVSYDYARLENMLIIQNHEAGRVSLSVTPEIVGKADGITCRIIFQNEEFSVTHKCVEIDVKNPKLWWPRGYGEQNLYEIKAELLHNGKVIDSCTKKIGLRTLTISREKDKYGEEFCFVVNGEKIFSMGADYIPQDNLLSRITYEKTEKLIKDCVKANFNTIRIWGGGIYPEDYFYDLCDEYGLIVWQDFMMACINVYLSKEFKETVIYEAIDNVKRLRHHASLGILCGNNEMEEFVYVNTHLANALERQDYLSLFEHILPDIVSEYAPGIFYWSSSPSSGGGLCDPQDENRGDAHYWQVWHGEKPFEEYRTHYFRFLSEFGFEAFPDMKTIKAFAREEDMNIFSEVMENHQKNSGANAKILNYCAQQFLYIRDFPKLVYASQVLQATAIKYAVEHFRRNRVRCMGTLYWQLNDCWPVASWSSLDYFGRWKALHFFAKKFYAPVLLSLHNEGTDIAFNISNETMQGFEGYVEFKICDKKLSSVYSGRLSINVDKLSSKDVFKYDFIEYVKGYEKERILVAYLFNKLGNKISEQTLMFVPPKRFSFEKPDVKVELNGNIIKVTSDVFVKAVEISFKTNDLELSDNFFDITDKNGVEITVDGMCDIEDIIIKTVNDIHE